MVKCPKCGREINHLGVEFITKYYSTYDKDGNFGEEYEGDTEVIFYCPECHRTLFFDEDDAYDFLNGEKVEVVVEENEV
jgi:predicted RNA-binding Zn-ribbon protein involved in translation (DUF1610 family)